jgi:hypothetical protein
LQYFPNFLYLLVWHGFLPTFAGNLFGLSLSLTTERYLLSHSTNEQFAVSASWDCLYMLQTSLLSHILQFLHR